MAENKRIQNSIDRLPGELLISIVSRLSLIEAGRTSVLARRWRYLWIYNSVLNFDALQVLGQLEERGTTLECERIRFVKWVNRVLILHSGATIDEFRIAFDLDGGFASHHLDRWIEFAFRKRVKKLELNTGVQIKPYAFPKLCHPIEHPRILSHGLSSCESLLTLSLTDVDVTEEVLVFFITNCPFLEELCVKGSRCLGSLRTSCPAVRLRRLEIVDCLSLGRLEVCSPNLLSYTFRGNKVYMDLKNVSNLASLSLGALLLRPLVFNLNQISRCLSRLETLTLHMSVYYGYEMISRSPHLPQLKKLVIDISASGHESLLTFIRLINAAPSLRKIVLKLTWSPFVLERPICQCKGLRHHLLEVLHIEGFAGYKTDVEFAQYVLEHAVSLKKIVIDFRRPLGGQQGDDVMGISEMTAKAREGVRLLKAKLRDGAELILR